MDTSLRLYDTKLKEELWFMMMAHERVKRSLPYMQRSPANGMQDISTDLSICFRVCCLAHVQFLEVPEDGSQEAIQG